MVIGSPEK
uniref:Uncharacterized protein n=1 Tax=Rhizophora mucronata TaxID=61149 RepID=A0A2P2QEE4_RHIMU